MPGRPLGSKYRARETTAIAALLAAALFVQPARAHSYKLGEITIGHLWSPSYREGPLFVYGPLLNRGDASDRLVAASSPLADESSFCASPKKGGACVSAIELAPGKPYAMAPWRPAIRLSGTKRALGEGETFLLTLTFEQAGEVTVEVVVEKASGH